ncbi:TPA: adenosylmethionine decarboxylase [Candidatus Sumerlaeota bacterium]|jgi:S-adenosylmethionine decarboxylase|nr:adenosylmethionine decarboxylase [Candidatus Sumerlaeota bacterium]
MENTILAPSAYCGVQGPIKFAGIHLIIELWKARHMTDPTIIETLMKQAVEACGATLLSIDLHVFSPGGGVSGVAVLQESHISIHTWPEYEYAAMDIFVCGTIDPYKALPVLKDGFEPETIQVVELKRGIFS